MTTVLGLDPSTYMGWCVGRHDGKPVYGVHRLPKAKHSRQALALEEFLIDKLKANGVDIVYAEKPIMPKVTSFDAMAGMIGKYFVIAMTCERLGINMIPIDMASWRSEFGVATQAPRRVPKPERRKWVKQQTLARCEALGYAPETDDAGDAIGIWWAATQRIRSREAAPTLFEADIAASLDI